MFCTEYWPSKHARQAYTLVVMVAQFVVPFSLMAFCYAAIFARLKSRTRVRLKRLAARSLTLEHSTTTFPVSNSTDRIHNATLSLSGKDEMPCDFSNSKVLPHTIKIMKLMTNIKWFR